MGQGGKAEKCTWNLVDQMVVPKHLDLLCGMYPAGTYAAQGQQRWALYAACQGEDMMWLPDIGLGTSTGQGAGQSEKGQAAPASRSILIFPGSRAV